MWAPDGTTLGVGLTLVSSNVVHLLTQGGMGAALLSDPDKIEAVSTLCSLHSSGLRSKHPLSPDHGLTTCKHYTYSILASGNHPPMPCNTGELIVRIRYPSVECSFEIYRAYMPSV